MQNVKTVDSLIIDNIICSFCLNLENGIPIKPYCDSNEDYELEFLADILMKMKPCDEVEKFIEREFGFKHFYQSLCL